MGGAFVLSTLDSKGWYIFHSDDSLLYISGTLQMQASNHI